TENFRVFSDLDVAEAHEITLQLERDLDALSQATFESGGPRIERTDVVVFADVDDYHHFSPQSSEGVFYAGLPLDMEASHTVITYGSVNPYARSRLLHELTHDLF